MIIKLERYNEIRELLIENKTTGSQGHVHYQDGDWRVSVTRALVCMEVKGMGMWTGYRGTYNQSPSQEWEQVCIGPLQSKQRSISTQWHRNRVKIKRVGTLRPQVHQLIGLLMRWHGWCMVVWSSCDGHMTSEGIHIPEAMGEHSDKGSGPIHDVTRGDHRALSGVVETNWHSQGSSKRRWWSELSQMHCKTIEYDLALGMDCDTDHPWITSLAHFHKLSHHPHISGPWPNTWSL